MAAAAIKRTCVIEDCNEEFEGQSEVCPGCRATFYASRWGGRSENERQTYTQTLKKRLSRMAYLPHYLEERKRKLELRKKGPQHETGSRNHRERVARERHRGGGARTKRRTGREARAAA